MATLNDVRACIESSGIPSEQCGFFSLDMEDQWPCSDEAGVYALFSGDRLLYIGMSQSAMGSRLDRHYPVKPGDTWTLPPTHAATWKCQSNVAPGLEEYLIKQLSPPDNTQLK